MSRPGEKLKGRDVPVFHRRLSNRVGNRISAALIALAMASGVAVPSPAAGDEAHITGTASIIDGNTIDVGPVRIRLHGIDAPEAGQECGAADGGTWPCGDTAIGRLAEFVEGKEVECIADDRDDYGRIIAVCYADGVDVNAALVREGLAWAFVRFSDDYASLEAEAKAAARGVWQGEAETPWDYRADKWAHAAEASPRPGCPIKGDVSPSGEHLYIMPWSPGYDQIVIDEAASERWFCDEAEAQVAGWRAPKWR